MTVHILRCSNRPTLTPCPQLIGCVIVTADRCPWVHLQRAHGEHVIYALLDTFGQGIRLHNMAEPRLDGCNQSELAIGLQLPAAHLLF